MTNYTPLHDYKEIVDYIPPQKDVIRGKIVDYLLLFIYIAIIGWAIMRILLCGSILHGIVYAIALIIIGIFIGVVFMFIHLRYSPGKPRLKSNYSSVVKKVIGYDFGDDYKLLYTGSHDYEEYLYIFSKDSFEPLKRHLESIPEGEDNVTGRVVKHSFKGVQGAGFSLVEDRLGDGPCGNKESIEVDYKERTLKHKFVVY
jgi:hypothetical protein